MKKPIKILLISAVSIALVILIILGSIKLLGYFEASRLCRKIESGETIDTTFANGSTAPIFFDEIAAVMQIQGPKIPLVEACYYKNVQAVEVLLENGADPNRFIDGRWSPLEASLVRIPNKQGTELAQIDDRSFEIIKLLVGHGCNVNKYASEPVVLQLSVMLDGDEDQLYRDIFLYLLDNGADKEYDGYEKTFHNIVLQGNVSLVELLISEYDFNANGKDTEGKTPLMKAVTTTWSEPSAQMVSLLLENGADRALKDGSGKTAYDYAVENGNTELAELLRNTGDGSMIDG